MERVYEFEKNAYRNKVLLVNVLLIPILGYCLYRIFFVSKNSIIWLIAAAVCVYALASSLLRKSTPRIIKINDEEIVFSSFGEKRFEIAKLTKFRVRVSTPGYQVLVRLEDSDRRKGSFWVTYGQFNDKKDLLAEFDYLEKKIHPDSLRFRGRGKMGDKRPVQGAVEEAGQLEQSETTEKDEASSGNSDLS
jgi:hypothetical protein